MYVFNSLFVQLRSIPCRLYELIWRCIYYFLSSELNRYKYIYLMKVCEVSRPE